MIHGDLGTADHSHGYEDPEEKLGDLQIDEGERLVIKEGCNAEVNRKEQGKWASQQTHGDHDASNDFKPRGAERPNGGEGEAEFSDLLNEPVSRWENADLGNARVNGDGEANV
jgi:hypothetical protein